MSAGPRPLLEIRFAQLYADMDELFAQTRDRARGEFAEQLNQMVRRLRLAQDLDTLCDTLADSASRFAEGAMLFRLEDGAARNPRIAIPLSDAPAIASAASSADPLVVLATPAEVSAGLIELLGHDDSARVHLFPVLAGETAPAVIYAWGAVQGPAIELLTQVAAAAWSAQPAPIADEEDEAAPVPELVTIALAPIAEAAAATAEAAPETAAHKTATTWEGLSATDQQMHLRAQRFARVQVAEMRLQHAEAVQSGRTRRRLYEELREPIDAAREQFRAQFFNCPSMVDYLDLELTRTLAHEDPELFGQSYPGPLVH